MECAVMGLRQVGKCCVWGMGSSRTICASLIWENAEINGCPHNASEWEWEVCVINRFIKEITFHCSGGFVRLLQWLYPHLNSKPIYNPLATHLNVVRMSVSLYPIQQWFHWSSLLCLASRTSPLVRLLSSSGRGFQRLSLGAIEIFIKCLLESNITRNSASWLGFDWFHRSLLLWTHNGMCWTCHNCVQQTESKSTHLVIVLFCSGVVCSTALVCALQN